MTDGGKTPKRRLKWANLPARDRYRIIDINVARRAREQREAERAQNDRPEPPEPRPAAGRAA